jgi:ribosomal protein S18 acetylase RimI-like enzyme
MLVVSPRLRGLGVGRALTDECIRRARRDQAPLIALHTSPIMSVALPMYLRLGFTFVKEVSDIFGVPYGVYAKPLQP